MRRGEIFQIDWRQGNLRWKTGDQILSPRNRDRSESDNGERKNEPGIYPDTKTAIRGIVDSSMDFVECLHEELDSSVNHFALIDRGLERLAAGFFGLTCETSAGYVIVMPRTFAKDVSV